MAQHFLLSPAARTLTLAQVARMSDQEAEKMFRALRWASTDGAPVCPSCGSLGAYEARRASGALRFRCREKECRADFTITSGTLFHAHKMPLRSYLLAVLLACNEVKGKNALALSRELGVSYKVGFVLMHKIRESMAQETKGLRVGGEGEVAEVDGLYVGGHIRPANLKEHRIDRRMVSNPKRRVVVVVRARGGRTLTTVVPSESAALSFIRERVAKGTTVHADESPAWNDLAARFAMKRINHQQGYRMDGACTNAAESFFSRIRRGEAGHFHHISGPYLHRYAQEAAFREDRRRDSNGDQARATVRLALTAKPSVDFCGYWQRHKA